MNKALTMKDSIKTVILIDCQLTDFNADSRLERLDSKVNIYLRTRSLFRFIGIVQFHTSDLIGIYEFHVIISEETSSLIPNTGLPM